jgi:hypothetical protein
MRGALGRRMIVVGALCALGIAGAMAEMLATLPYLAEEGRAPAATAPAMSVSFKGMSAICPGLIGWLGAWGYLASWIWLPAATWRVRRRHREGGRVRSLDLLLPSLVGIEIVLLQCLLRLTPLAAEGYPLL